MIPCYLLALVGELSFENEILFLQGVVAFSSNTIFDGQKQFAFAVRPE